ncbi:MAG: FAD-dependent oxidoreductase [Bernardetiaceae bacterium]|jgi:glycine/D-amino acid oxidase-like deaminating enzyme|nr:FAD-dependent oxidoreductase [Bernardetiaceae bacterium]
MQVDCLIVGQGIAGTVLAFTLQQRGWRVLVADPGEPASASRVAAGLVNPITGHRLVKTWLADDLFPFLHQFYPALEQQLGASFFHPRPLYRPFESVAHQNQALADLAEARFAPYLRPGPPAEDYGRLVHDPFGGVEVAQAGFVDTPALLAAAQAYLRARDSYRPAPVPDEALEITPDGVRWQSVTAQLVVFCRGWHEAQSHYWSWLPFRPVKGEILLGQLDGPDFSAILNRGCWVVPPAQAGGLYKVGATYHWQTLDTQPTEAAHQELAQKLAALLKPTFRPVGQVAGVRPATADRKPFLGRHPAWPRLAIFGGLGTKGISLAPFLAAHLAQHLEGRAGLLPAVDAARYWPR